MIDALRSLHSPYQDSPHKARSGELSKTCRNRHCPKCQAGAARRWLQARQADLLPVDYYHVVFTLPAPIADIAYQNKAAIYGLLFDVAAEVPAVQRSAGSAGSARPATMDEDPKVSFEGRCGGTVDRKSWRL